ncbi:glycogen debranching protein GlgX [Limibaculum sp. M0105]|uniref:Glycogen debranching protein GlgX n=1 Tax=Thermohalobaculum xanthum TaxID=2753746 RepID=A0A8J7M5K7_9RHOB|nr:glycogen debranching protein GlgX [Thermohalobaculum xanthum]MBK0397839.1 glycogen debranching protein GlgX [Thermohalobaculum xanthum]
MTPLSPPAPAEIRAGSPDRLGAHLTGEGVNFAVFSANAAQIEVCLFDTEGRETARAALPERTGDIWHGEIPGLSAGTLYGLRAHGAYAPERGLRFNAHKLLIDPYTRALSGRFVESDAIYGYDRRAPGADLTFDTRDSAPFVPKCVVVPPEAAPPPPPRRDWGETLIYEAHLKGLTKRFPGLDPELAGTWEALGQPRVIEHLLRLGVTAIELLPVQALRDEGFLIERGLTNYWGYNSIGYFAPEPRYMGPRGREGMRATIAALHGAGIEVILDVVLNHSAEGDHTGPTLSFRGLDNRSYYRLQPGRARFNIDDTGCGNTLDLSNPMVARMALDSLRHWVTDWGVDGFRFDLATTLAREAGGFDPMGGFLDALRQDPVLAGVKLVAEPWDVGPGGYRLGGFPPPFAEWNDRFRDDVRRFWRGDDHAAPDLAARLMGSAEIFDRAGRRSWSSVNYVASHDGFTLADLTTYARRHNEANAEGNRDGHAENFSDNCGTEGPADVAGILLRRARRMRNLLATLFLSQGTPMLLAGDEVGNSQWGNNNAYCQDNGIGWVDWGGADEALLRFVARLSAVRRAHPVLRQTRFLHGGTRDEDGAPDVEWQDLAGGALNWRNPRLRGFCLRLRGAAEAPPSARVAGDVLIAVNGTTQAASLAMPAAPDGMRWMRVIDTARPERDEVPADETRQALEGDSVVLFAASPAPEAA